MVLPKNNLIQGKRIRRQYSWKLSGY